MRTTYVLRDGKLVEKSLAYAQDREKAQAAAVHVFQPIRSPIDGSEINSPAQLAEHNRRYGVTNDPDSLKEQTERHFRKQQQPYTGTRAERVQALVRAYDFMQQNPHLRGRGRHAAEE